MKQLIIVRKDLQMSPGKLAAQVAHASIAFITHKMREPEFFDGQNYYTNLMWDKDTYEQWFCGSFTKIICGAKNQNQLLKAVQYAQELNLIENKHFFLIRDNCLTELQPEDEDGRTLTCIGFQPLPDETSWKISKKYQLYT